MLLIDYTSLINIGELLPVFVMSVFFKLFSCEMNAPLASLSLTPWLWNERCYISANLIVFVSLWCHGCNAVRAQHCTLCLFCDAAKTSCYVKIINLLKSADHICS